MAGIWVVGGGDAAAQTPSVAADSLRRARATASSDSVCRFCGGAPGVTVIDGETLRRAGAASLGDALAGKVAGLELFMTPGMFGSLPQVQLRGTSTFLGYDAPLVLVDDVPVRLGAEIPEETPSGDTRIAPVLLTNLPLADVERVEVLRGPVATAGYGPRASAGVIRIVTRAAPSRGIEAGLSQRAGIGEATETPRSRAFSRADALAERVFFLTLTPEQRAASWDSCNGDCGTFDAVFGGSRSIVQTDAWVRGRTANTGWSVGATGRRSGRELRGPHQSYAGGRVGFDRTFGARVSVRAAQLIARTADEDPSSSNELGTLFVRPSWLNLRGVPGAYDATAIAWNPLVSLDSLRSPRALWQYLTTVKADVRLWRSARTDLAFEALGGLHRAVRTDTLEYLVVGTDDGTPPVAGAGRFVHRHASRESFLSAALRLTTPLAGAAVATSLGVEKAGERHSLAGNGAQAMFGTRSTMALFANQHWDVAADRAQIDVSFRRDDPEDLGVLSGALHAWRAAVSYDAVGSSRSRLTLRGGIGQVQWSPASELWVVPPRFIFAPLPPFADPPRDRRSPETRTDVEAGADLVLANGRVRIGGVAYVISTTHAFVPGPVLISTMDGYMAPTGELRNHAFELDVRTTPVRTSDREWSLAFIAARSRTTVRSLRDVAPFGGRLEYGGRLLEQGTSLFRIAQVAADGATINNVGNAEPSLSFAQLNDVRWSRLRLSTQLDGHVGGDVVNETRYAQDGWELSGDVADGGRARRDAGRHGQPIYVQNGGYVRLREAVVSYDVVRGGGRGMFAAGARLELAGRNLATWSGLDVLDPASRSVSMPMDLARVTTTPLVPLLRSVTLALVVGR